MYLTMRHLFVHQTKFYFFLHGLYTPVVLLTIVYYYPFVFSLISCFVEQIFSPYLDALLNGWLLKDWGTTSITFRSSGPTVLGHFPRKHTLK